MHPAIPCLNRQVSLTYLDFIIAPQKRAMHSEPLSHRIRRALRSVAVGFALLPLAACGPRAEVGYKVTVTVDDNGTLRSGTGVWKLTMRKGDWPGTYASAFYGEAIPIDLGKKGILYVLITGNRGGRPGAGDDLGIYGRHLFGQVAKQRRGESVEIKDPLTEHLELQRMTGQTARLGCRTPIAGTPCPFLVRFRDDHDPGSVEAVNPGNLVSTYGPGMTLRPIVVQLTDEPVTTGIGKRLPWLSDYPEPHVRPNVGQRDQSPEAWLTHGAFRRSER